MKSFIWISRHPLTDGQRSELEALGFTKIIEAGDCNAFDPEALLSLVERHTPHWAHPLDAPVVVGVVHPAAALHLKNAGYWVAVAENVNRAPEGERPRFEFQEWHLF